MDGLIFLLRNFTVKIFQDYLERVQKSAVKLILGEKDENYEEGLIKANLDSLKDRRELLCQKFASKCVSSDNPRAKNMFQVKKHFHPMKIRNNEKFDVKFANTERLKKSSIPYMQRILNSENKSKENQLGKRKLLKEENTPGSKTRKPG